MRHAWIRTALLIIVGIPVTVAGAIAIVNYGYPWVYPSGQEPGEAIVVPLAPLPDDDSFPTLSRIAGEIDKTVKERECLDGSASDRSYRECLLFLDTQAGALTAFDAWRATSAAYKLERPANLGRHSRAPVAVKIDDPVPDFPRFRALAKLLALRAQARLYAGRVADAERDLQTIFSLGSYLQQNPLLIGQAVGNTVHQIGLHTIVRHVIPGAIGENSPAMLPSPQHLLEGMRLAIGSEWTFELDLYKRKAMEAEGFTAFIAKSLGLYSVDHTLRLAATREQGSLHHLTRGKLGSAYSVIDFAACDWDAMGPIKWIHNPIGRYLVFLSCNPADPPLLRYIGQTGQTIDRVEATRVVIAARRFWLRHRRWPTQAADLVPAFLKEWPKSALDGQPLRWMDNRNGVYVLTPDGNSPCKEDESCRFPFEPSQPIPIATDAP